MGLNFKGGARWSYSGFNRFRTKLAGQVGITLDKMQGFGGKNSWDFETDDIIPLLHHSGCGGELTVKECKKVWPRLKELIEDWGSDNYDKINALRLIEGMKGAIKNSKPLRF